MRYTVINIGQKDEFGKDKIATMSMGDNILRHINFAGQNANQFSVLLKLSEFYKSK